MKEHTVIERTKTINKTIDKLKVLFKIKKTRLVLEHRLGALIKDKRERLIQKGNLSLGEQGVNYYDLGFEFVDKFYKKLDDIHYSLEVIGKQHQELTPFKLYKIFRLCLDAINEDEFFKDTIGNIKDYDHKKNRASIDEIKLFIPTLKEEQIRIPRNPNEIYNLAFFIFTDDYKLEKNDAINLLSTIYDYEKKAKFPKKTKQELKELKEIFYKIVEVGGKDKNLSDKEIQNELKQINNEFKNYL